MSKPKYNPEVRITFTLGGTHWNLEQMLWNMRRRAAVGGPMVVEIDGDRSWWDDRLAESERLLLESTRQWAEYSAKHKHMRDEFARDPSRSDDEIADLVGMPPSKVREHREHRDAEARRQAERQAIEELATDPARTLGEIANAIGRGGMFAVSSYFLIPYDVDPSVTVGQVAEAKRDGLLLPPAFPGSRNTRLRRRRPSRYP